MAIDNLTQLISSSLNSSGIDSILNKQSYEFSSIFVNKVNSDSTNPRFIPSVFIEDLHAYQMIERKITKAQLIKLYNATNKVLIGKGCIVNCFTHGTT